MTFFTTPYDADTRGYFGEFGGRYVPEMLVPPLDELTRAYQDIQTDPAFFAEFSLLLNTFVGRPSPLTYAENLSDHLGGARIYLKNEGANLTGAHKINHCVGQALMQKNLAKKHSSRKPALDSTE